MAWCIGGSMHGREIETDLDAIHKPLAINWPTGNWLQRLICPPWPQIVERYCRQTILNITGDRSDVFVLDGLEVPPAMAVEHVWLFEQFPVPVSEPESC